MVLKFDPRCDKMWTVPEPLLFHDLINRVHCQIQKSDLRCKSAYRWANMWGKVGLLGLSPANKDYLNEYRGVIEDQVLGEINFTIFPKEGLEKKGNLSVLLRENFRAYQVECLPRALFDQSRKLRGQLRVTHVRTYPDSARSRAGASKRGWRLLLLQGCDEFLDSLKHYDLEYKFPVGSGHVLIRGGSGRPKPTPRDPGRSQWRQQQSRLGPRQKNGPSGAQQQQQGPSHQRQQQGQRSQQQRDQYNNEPVSYTHLTLPTTPYV